MRNLLFIVILVFIVVVAGGASILWFMQASQIKQNVETTIANINAKQQLITYESIQTSGFPSDVIVSIVKPHIAGRIDQLLSQLPQPAGQPAPALPEWDEDQLLDGTVSIGINALSDHYTMSVSGSWHDNTKIGGQSVAANIVPNGNSTCSLTMQHGTGLMDKLWNFKALFNNDSFGQDFRMLDCIFPSYTATDPATNETVLSSGGGRLYITNAPQANTRQVRFYVKSTDAQIMPAGDKIVAAYFAALAPKYPMMTKISDYGKQNIEIDLAYDGPASMQGDIKTIPLDVNLSKFTMSNQVYTSDGTLHLSHNVTGDARQAKLTFNLNDQMSEQYNVILQDMVRHMIEQLYLPTNPQAAQLQPILKAYTPDQLYASVSPAIPDFHALGKLTQALDVSYQGSVSNMMSGDINLANLELSATPYGITGKGSAKMTQGQPIPAANFTFVCTNCLHMIDDTADYMTRLQKAVAVFNPTQALALQVDPAVVDGLKQFLSALTAPATDPSTFTYTIISDGTPNITINGKPTAQVMTLYGQYLAPALQKHQAAAATAPAAAPSAITAPAGIKAGAEVKAGAAATAH